MKNYELKPGITGVTPSNLEELDPYGLWLPQAVNNDEVFANGNRTDIVPSLRQNRRKKKQSGTYSEGALELINKRKKDLATYMMWDPNDPDELEDVPTIKSMFEKIERSMKKRLTEVSGAQLIRDFLEEVPAGNYEDFLTYAHTTDIPEGDIPNESRFKDVVRGYNRNQKGKNIEKAPKKEVAFDPAEHKYGHNMNVMAQTTPTEEIAKTVQSVADKYEFIYNMTIKRLSGNFAGKRHLFIYGTPGVGKTFTVSKAIKKSVEQKPSLRIHSFRGTTGASMTALLTMLFNYRHKEDVLVLDDCDNILTAPEDSPITNVLKGAFDPERDPVTKRAKSYVSIGFGEELRSRVAASHKGLTGYAGDYSEFDSEGNELTQSISESGLFFAMDRLEEGIIDVYCEGVRVGEELLEEVEDIQFWQEMKQHMTQYSLREAAEEGKGKILAPVKFLYEGTTVFISNLMDIPGAVKDRLYKLPLILEPMEIAERIEQVLEFIDINGVGYSEMEEAWAKANVVVMLQDSIYCYEHGITKTADGSLLPVAPVKASITFRLFTELCDGWLYEYDAITSKSGEVLSLEELEKQIYWPFFYNHLKPALSSPDKKK